MSLFSFKKVKVPAGEVKELTAYESWTISWDSGYRRYQSSDYFHTKRQSEVFTNEDDAKAFKKALDDALALLKDGKDRNIIIEKN